MGHPDPEEHTWALLPRHARAKPQQRHMYVGVGAVIHDVMLYNVI